MSDIYLTKVERKTIFTQGLIYVLFTFVISDLTVTGPHIFCIIPWLFFLGILGVNKFYHPIMTVVISTVTTFIASLFKFNGLNLQVLTSVLVAFVVTTSGLIVGLCIKDFILEHRLLKQLPVHKKILNITVMTLLTIGSIVLYAAKYGNVIGYVQSRIKLDDYMKFQEYEIEHEQFLPGSFGRYVYAVNVQNETLKLKIGKEIELINFEELQNKAEISLNKEFKENFITEEIVVNLTYEYIPEEIIPQGIIATITVENIDGKNEEAIMKVVNEINRVCNYKNNEVYVDKIILSIDGGIQIINKHDFDKISKEYIKNSVNVDTFDMN